MLVGHIRAVCLLLGVKNDELPTWPTERDFTFERLVTSIIARQFGHFHLER